MPAVWSRLAVAARATTAPWARDLKTVGPRLRAATACSMAHRMALRERSLTQVHVHWASIAPYRQQMPLGRAMFGGFAISSLSRLLAQVAPSDIDFPCGHPHSCTESLCLPLSLRSGLVRQAAIVLGAHRALRSGHSGIIGTTRNTWHENPWTALSAASFRPARPDASARQGRMPSAPRRAAKSAAQPHSRMSSVADSGGDASEHVIV